MQLSDEKANELAAQGSIRISVDEIRKMDFTHLACAWCKGGPIKAEGKPYLSYAEKSDGGDGAYRWMQVFSHPTCETRAGHCWCYCVAMP